jgi:glycosyltransferase involved in cell wall biosynthesis
MRIVYITPGSGGKFYCQNCYLDSQLIQSLQMLGHEVTSVPMYLPTQIEADEHQVPAPVFYGAINLYLKEKIPVFRHTPQWMERLLDSPGVLHLAAKLSGSTNPAGLEEMTLSMLRGESGRQAAELDQLVAHLKATYNPDLIHLSNALLLGLARKLKAELNTRVVCSLQDEHEWIDLMSKDYQKKIRDLMAGRARDVDLFITASHFYADKSAEQLNLPADRMAVVAGGISFRDYQQSPLPFEPPVIGYMCRMSQYFGLDILVEAFLKLKHTSRFNGLRLHLTGGYSTEDKPFVKKMIRRISSLGFKEDVTVFKRFDKQGRIDFLKSLTLMTVPVPSGEAFGIYQLEALAAGVPVVQPRLGGYPEFIKNTGGGILYHPNDSIHLAAAIDSLLGDPTRVNDLAKKGYQAVRKKYSITASAEAMAALYQKVITTGRAAQNHF